MKGAADEMTTGSMVVQTGVTGAAITFFSSTIVDMIPYLIASLMLIMVDLVFGIKAAVSRKETIRLSRAIRRTVGKIFEYLCWVSLSATLSVAFDAQVVEWVILGIIMGNELISIITNFFEAHGKKISGLNIWKIVGQKADIDLDGVRVEDIDRYHHQQPEEQHQYHHQNEEEAREEHLWER